MAKYERMKQDMTTALKNGDKLRRITLADMIAAIDKVATSGKIRVEITDGLVNETLTKYQKMVQEMIDTCPDSAKYANRKAEYKIKLAIVKEYAPIVVDSADEIQKMIRLWSCANQVEIVPQNRGMVMKMIMPWLKENHCDMKVAQAVLKSMMDNA